MVTGIIVSVSIGLVVGIWAAERGIPVWMTVTLAGTLGLTANIVTNFVGLP